MSGAGLSRVRAIPLAFGSVAGSGILFLPSAVFAAAGSSSYVVWLIAIALCIPMLLMFQDMVRANPGDSGIESFVRRGLGVTVSRTVPILFVALVIIGIPAGSIVAGRYVAAIAGAGATLWIAVGVVVAALAVNLAGGRSASWVQLAGSALLIAVALVLIVSALADPGRLPQASPPVAPAVILPAVVLGFWAFAGFENLTFLSKQFRDPHRDFLPVSVIALSLYGALTLLLTFALSTVVANDEVDEVAGLMQLADRLEPRVVVLVIVAVVAVGAMSLNAVSWTWGVSQLIADAASRGVLPSALQRVNARQVPTRALAALAVLFAASLGVVTAFPGILVDALAAASSIFILMYVLCIVAYLRVARFGWRPLLNALLLPIMVAGLAQSGWRALYGVGMLVLALVWSRFAVRKP